MAHANATSSLVGAGRASEWHRRPAPVDSDVGWSRGLAGGSRSSSEEHAHRGAAQRRISGGAEQERVERWQPRTALGFGHSVVDSTVLYLKESLRLGIYYLLKYLWAYLSSTYRRPRPLLREYVEVMPL